MAESLDRRVNLLIQTVVMGSVTQAKNQYLAALRLDAGDAAALEGLRVAEIVSSNLAAGFSLPPDPLCVNSFVKQQHFLWENAFDGSLVAFGLAARL